MTSLALLLWIVSGIVLQLAIYLGIGFWRHWQDYQALRHRAAEFNLPVAPFRLSRQATLLLLPGRRSGRFGSSVRSWKMPRNRFVRST